jgi:hypothetical protein
MISYYQKLRNTTTPQQTEENKNDFERKEVIHLQSKKAWKLYL